MAQFLTMRAARDLIPWICIDEYKRFYLSWCSRNHNSGVPKEELPLFRRWVLDALAGDVLIDTETTGGVGSYYMVWFSDDADIILFKLSKWYNEELNRNG